MSKNPLDVLKSGLTNLKNLTKTRRDDLLARLHRKEKISAKEEEWLDNAANSVDEEVLWQHQNPTPWITCGLYKGTQRF